VRKASKNQSYKGVAKTTPTCPKIKKEGGKKRKDQQTKTQGEHGTAIWRKKRKRSRKQIRQQKKKFPQLGNVASVAEETSSSGHP